MRNGHESYDVAVGFAYGYGVKTVSDPDKDLHPDSAVKKMVTYVVHGVPPLEEAQEVSAEYWEKLQQVAQRRITLADYRLADLVIAAAERVYSERSYSEKLWIPWIRIAVHYLRSNDYIIPVYWKVIDGAVAEGIEEAIPPAILGGKERVPRGRLRRDGEEVRHHREVFC